MKEVPLLLVLLLLVTMVSAGNLLFDHVDLKVENPGESTRRDSTIEQGQVSRIEVHPGAKMIITSYAQNLGKDLTNAHVNLNLGHLDGDLPIERGSETFDLDADTTHRAEIELRIPALTHEGIYPVELELIGEGNEGEVIAAHFSFSIEIKKREFDAAISIVDVSTERCRGSGIGIEVTNTGRHTLPQGTLVIQGSGVSKTVTIPPLIWGSGDNSVQRIKVDVPPDAQEITAVLKLGTITKRLSLNVPQPFCPDTPRTPSAPSPKQVVVVPYPLSNSPPFTVEGTNQEDGYDFFIVIVAIGVIIVITTLILQGSKFFTKQ